MRKDKYPMLSRLWNFRKKTDEQSGGVMREANKEIDSTLENKLSVAAGQGRGGKS